MCNGKAFLLDRIRYPAFSENPASRWSSDKHRMIVGQTLADDLPAFGHYNVPLDMKGCICHLSKWQIHHLISILNFLVEQGATDCVWLCEMKRSVTRALTQQVAQVDGWLSAAVGEFFGGKKCSEGSRIEPK